MNSDRWIYFRVLVNVHCICTYMKFDLCSMHILHIYGPFPRIHIFTLKSNRCTHEPRTDNTHTFMNRMQKWRASLYTFILFFTSVADSHTLKSPWYFILFMQKLKLNRTNENCHLQPECPECGQKDKEKQKL